MNQNTIAAAERASEASYSGEMTFPEIVGLLLENGVGRYQVDFLRKDSTYYTREGEVIVIEAPMPAKSVSRVFCRESMAANVKSSQLEGQRYPTFLQRAFDAGCVGYSACLDGRMVIYFGELGEQHIEHFPRSD